METSRYNYYDILEVNQHCAQHEITTAYQRAKSTYSGENPAIYTIFSELEARDLLGLVEEAYQVLGNKTLRTIYDEKLSAGVTRVEELSFEALLAASKVLFPEIQKKPQLEIVDFSRDEEFEKKMKATTDWDGNMLRQVRDYKKVSIEKMSEVTKISSYYLKAIENMEPQGLPALVFVRGYIIQICRFLGLDEKIVTDSYMKRYKALLGK